MNNDKPNNRKNQDIPNDQADRGYIHNLKYNKNTDSFEYDIENDPKTYPNEEAEYQHDDPYDTVAPQGKDDNSDWDEANLYVGDEYDKNKSLETDIDSLGMHIDKGRITKLKKADKEISKTPEDLRDDLDEEGYPKREP
ncbi:hypothetical protein H8S90_12345 [Olivibacter sp. SDN3]|uniref:hypothetical protein n=1 Tax=Olivibacter sp. SDN3 TaxID=2764720 RepID=UPI0016510F05|nr:hypothetical protein [Olivibacter sp. SDN3]QNL52283.1 hypothetical protein H8S90_12345 [Olivibacter sp. SDN3]